MQLYITFVISSLSFFFQTTQNNRFFWSKIVVPNYGHMSHWQFDFLGGQFLIIYSPNLLSVFVFEK